MQNFKVKMDNITSIIQFFHRRGVSFKQLKYNLAFDVRAAMHAGKFTIYPSVAHLVIF